MKNIITYLGIIFFTLSCGKQESGLTFSENSTGQFTQTADVSYAQIKSAILAPHCLQCHSDVGTEKGLGKWVSPGDPGSSSFFNLSEDGSMPKNTAPLSTKDLELISNYILSLKPKAPIPTPVPPQNPNLVTYAQIKQNVLTPYSCLNCHGVGTEAKIAKWINLKNPSQSLLYTRVHDGTMPQGRSDVPLAQQALLLQYVKDYASIH